MKIIKTGEFKPRDAEGYLYLAIEGDSPSELMSLDAKKLAWNARFEHGFGNAGIESWRAPFPLKPSTAKKKENGTVKYATVFRLIPGLP